MIKDPNAQNYVEATLKVIDGLTDLRLNAQCCDDDETAQYATDTLADFMSEIYPYLKAWCLD